MSDWDYLMDANARQRATAKWMLPRGQSGGAADSGIDVFNGSDNPLDPNRPFVSLRQIHNYAKRKIRSPNIC